MGADLASVGILIAQTLHHWLPNIVEQDAAWLMVGAGAALIWLLGRWNYGARVPDSRWFLGPNWLWRLIYNRVSVQRGASYSVSRASRIAIVTDRTQEAVAQDLLQRLQGRNLRARVVYVDVDPAISPTAKLASELDSSDAVYVLWTDAMQETRGLAETLTKWATENSAKPLLVVNLLTIGEYNLTIPALASGDAVNGLPLLLTRAIDRAQAWRHQATLMRRFAFAGGFAAVLLVAVAYNAYREFRQTQALLVWNEPAFLNLQSSLERFHGDEDHDRARESSVQPRIGTANGPLSSGAVFVESMLSEWFVIPAAERPQVSYWRRMRVRPLGAGAGGRQHTVLVQVAWNGDRPATVFGDVDTTIIGAAFADPEICIAWHQNAKQHELAAWDTDLQDAGEFVGKDSLEIFRSHRISRYGHLDSDPARVGLLCCAEASRDRHVVSGIAIDTHSNPLELKTKPVARLLQLALAFVNTVPDEMLLSESVQGALRADSLEVVTCGGAVYPRPRAQEPASTARIDSERHGLRSSKALIRGGGK